VLDYDAGYYGKKFATRRKELTVYIQLPKKGNKKGELPKEEGGSPLLHFDIRQAMRFKHS
jgi:hypothetical protein